MTSAQFASYDAFTGVGRGAAGVVPRAIPSREPAYRAATGSAACGGANTGIGAGAVTACASTVGATAAGAITGVGEGMCPGWA